MVGRIQRIFTNDSGEPYVGYDVRVFIANTNIPAKLYVQDGTTFRPIGSLARTDSTGQITVYVGDSGLYTLKLCYPNTTLVVSEINQLDSSTSVVKDPIDVVSSRWAFPGMGPKFLTAVESLPVVEDYTFGSNAVASGGPNSRAITTSTALATLFNPLEGEFNANGQWTGGAGPTVIGSQPQRYNPSFASSANHVFDTDCLRLQATLGSGGSFQVLARGTIDTSGGAGGLNVNAVGGTTTTAMADIGLTQPDLDAIPIGAICNNAGSGWAVVTAKATGTITLETITGGTRSAYKVAYHITFLNLYFARLTGSFTNGTSTALTFTSVPAGVQAGMFALGCGGSVLVDPVSRGLAKVSSVVSTTVNFDAAIDFTSNNISSANSAGVMFVPQLMSGQIWTKRGYGPHRANKKVQAFRIEFTMPSMSNYASAGSNFIKSAFDTAYAAAPSVNWGMWPAIWLYTFRPNGIISGNRLPWSEIDILEMFMHVNRGPSVWSGNLHDQPYTRRRSLTTSPPASRISGASWQTTSAGNEALTADSSLLSLSAPLASGAKRSVGLVWTRDRVIHYLDDIPVCESSWSTDADYPHQLGMNVACGSLTAGNAANLFLPRTNAEATGMFMKIHTMKVWEL